MYHYSVHMKVKTLFVRLVFEVIYIKIQIFNFKLKGKFRGYVRSQNLLGTDQQSRSYIFCSRLKHKMTDQTD